MNDRLVLDAHPRYLITTDAASFAAAAAILLAVSRIRSLLSPLAVIILISCLALGFGLDVLIWYARGVRSIELDEESLTVYRGPRLEMQRFTREMVTAVSLRRRLWRQGAVILLGPKHRLRIMEDAFPKEPFERFLTALADWR